ncbi:hypothetical protein [Paracoccus aestuariivivens]|uniref:Uncharacterized protein n=1 Tax=Paracoccus aestuariivivens TaxID=1820333 RepID=A0A6L6JD82_9RHOB|nr:hypothetical protein [Paracoccus aestuariivivens]MTH77881.1 hypothetical protein [Paracoccus aestuariivivens]
MLFISPVDEAIWHFIGVFHLTDEVARLRINYDELTPDNPDVDPGTITPKDLVTDHPRIPTDYNPEVIYTPPVPVQEGLQTEADYVFINPVRDPVSFGRPQAEAFNERAERFLNHNWHVTPPTDPPDPDPPDPPDPDPPTPEYEWTMPPPGSVAAVTYQTTLLSDDDQFGSATHFGPDESGEQLASLCQQSGQLGVDLDIDLPADGVSFLSVAHAFRDVTAPDGDFGGAEASTRWGEDVLGQYFDGEQTNARPDFEDLMPTYRQERQDEDEDGDTEDDFAQHELVYGNNLLLNQASINDAWITAPVIAAGQGIYSYTIISQTNVWCDNDAIFTQLGLSPSNFDGTPTNALNFASYSIFSNPMPQQRGDADAPQYWLTATLEGSLICVNWIDQYNFVSDRDVSTVSLHTDKTLMLMGENGSMNEVSLAELGFQFDLIIIDGYMINLNAIIQTNVMLDNDSIGIGVDGAQVSAGDNLLYNETSITRIGSHSVTATNAAIDAMLRDAGNGEVNLPASILNDPAFSGRDIVRVLHIEGDMVSVNMIRQTNVLGDSDQIEVYRNEVVGTGAEVKVVAGSNVLVNSASISEFGVDSKIYTPGEHYSDALLHQAELVTPDAPAMPAGPPALASEAVLFLADGFLADNDDDHGFRPINADAPVPGDVMETVLA